MKNRWDSAESFEAYAVIDYCYWRLEKLHKELSKPVASINALIDEATGFKDQKEKEIAQEIVSLLDSAIESKKFLELDFSADEEFKKKILAKLNQ